VNFVAILDRRGSLRRSGHLARGPRPIVAATFATHKSDGMQTRTEEVTTPSGWASMPYGPTATAHSRFIVFFHHGRGLEEGSKQTMARSPSGATTW